MTRYSALIWARDLKVLSNSDQVEVSAPEDISWKKLIYRRDCSDGYDLIIHLVRLPSTEHWDIAFANEPNPLEGVLVKFKNLGGRITTAWGMRPYYFEEPQQPVVEKLAPRDEAGAAIVHVPSFRYYQMICIHVTFRTGTDSAKAA